MYCSGQTYTSTSILNFLIWKLLSCDCPEKKNMWSASSLIAALCGWIESGSLWMVSTVYSWFCTYSLSWTCYTLMAWSMAALLMGSKVQIFASVSTPKCSLIVTLRFVLFKRREIAPLWIVLCNQRRLFKLAFSLLSISISAETLMLPARASSAFFFSLGPLFFLIYINDLPDGFTGEVFMFADDSSVFHIVNKISLYMQQRWIRI